MSVTYKVVETAQVDDQSLEAILNDTVSEGWDFEGFHFVVQTGARRPTMAFVLFSRPVAGEGEEGP